MKKKKERSQQDKNDALRAVVFDAVVLATALEALDQVGHLKYDIGRGENQLAVETALIKFRSLYDFLFGNKNSREDDLTVGNLGCTAPKDMISGGESFRSSVHKYSAHLTWTRIAEQSDDAFLQRSASLRAPCELVLTEAWNAICEAISNGYQLNTWGQKYFDALKMLMNSRKTEIEPY